MDKKQEKSIHDKLREIIIEYEKETGIAITSVHMEWYNMVGTGFAPGKIEVSSQKY